MNGENKNCSSDMNDQVMQLLSFSPRLLILNAKDNQIPTLRKFANDLLAEIETKYGPRGDNNNGVIMKTPESKKRKLSTNATPGLSNGKTKTCLLCEATDAEVDLISCHCHSRSTTAAAATSSSEGIVLCEDCLETNANDGDFDVQFCQLCDSLTCPQCDRTPCGVQNCDQVICGSCRDENPDAWLFCDKKCVRCENGVWCMDCREHVEEEGEGVTCDFCKEESVIEDNEGDNDSDIEVLPTPPAAKRPATIDLSTPTITPHTLSSPKQCMVCDATIPPTSQISTCNCDDAITLCTECRDENPEEYIPCLLCQRITCPNCDRMECDGPQCTNAVCHLCQEQKNLEETWTFCKCENSIWCSGCSRKSGAEKTDSTKNNGYPPRCGCCSAILACGEGECDIAGKCGECGDTVCGECMRTLECDNPIVLCAECEESYICEDCDICLGNNGEEDDDE